MRKLQLFSIAVLALIAISGTNSEAAPPGGGGDPVAGEAAYLANCRMCHGLEAVGGFAQRDVRKAGASRISGAISRRADMNFFETRPNPLTATEIDDIAAYFDTLPRGDDDIPANGDLVNGEDQYRESCTYCHAFGNGAGGQVGPDLIGVSTNYSDAFLGAWVGFPIEMVVAGAYPGLIEPYQMPDLGHPDITAWDIASFLLEQDTVGPIVESDPIDMPVGSPQYEEAKALFFNRCAGCHGIYRSGATGPDIGEVRSQAIGTDGLGAILRYGTPAGMPAFGQNGLLTEDEITKLAAYLQLTPPDPPPWTMSDIIGSWNLIIPVASRPTTPQAPNWENYTGVILRDAGQVSIIDATTHQEVVRLDTGFAVHILRSSSTGRYFYAVGRDGLVTLIDLWTAIPTTVATVKGCIDARSVEGSKAPGWEDLVAIEGCYWPPQYVTYDGLTLEPQNRVDVPMVDIYEAPLLENRTAAIAASHTLPLWILALKESGYVGIVDYTVAGHPLASTIATEKFLHDGGFDHTGRYFLVAANASDKMVVIDVDGPSFVTSFYTGSVPHPGRGANWIDPVYGWVNATQHIGEPKISVYGADPAGRPDVAWTVVREIAIPSSGSLFIKTHPNSPWVLFDLTLSSDPNIAKQICAISKATAAVEQCFDVATNGIAVHMEYNKDGTEVWISDWAVDGGVVILDAVTLAPVTSIYGPQTPSGQFITPTGKFNVYNTANDIY
jgi:nitrite reductase (NO-forming)/hydroxylamine reductase